MSLLSNTEYKQYFILINPLHSSRFSHQLSQSWAGFVKNIMTFIKNKLYPLKHWRWVSTIWQLDSVRIRESQRLLKGIGFHGAFGNRPGTPFQDASRNTPGQTKGLRNEVWSAWLLKILSNVNTYERVVGALKVVLVSIEVWLWTYTSVNGINLASGNGLSPVHYL